MRVLGRSNRSGGSGSASGRAPLFSRAGERPFAVYAGTFIAPTFHFRRFDRQVFLPLAEGPGKWGAVCLATRANDGKKEAGNVGRANDDDETSARDKGEEKKSKRSRAREHAARGV